MKHIVPVLVLCMVAFEANAASDARPAMSNRVMSAPRYTASINQLNGTINAMNKVVAGATTPEESVEEEEKDMREAERNACVNNNIGIGNTFVWASRYSNTSNYANMVEDVENPQNNVCFVRVELTSDDKSRVDVSDVESKYFMWGENIACGSWVNEQEMEKRILDTRKGARIGGIVAGSVGGAGLGVGAMELFGNELIDGKVQGQKSSKLSKYDLYRSQLLVLQNENPLEYNRIVGYLRVIKDGHDAGAVLQKDYDKTYKPLIDEFVK